MLGRKLSRKICRIVTFIDQNIIVLALTYLYGERQDFLALLQRDLLVAGGPLGF